jgi:hypothetical protein
MAADPGPERFALHGKQFRVQAAEHDPVRIENVDQVGDSGRQPPGDEVHGRTRCRVGAPAGNHCPDQVERRFGCWDAGRVQ